ncbi:hypothetical protein [Nocardia sp. NPDC005366]|uniref:hypothetical protein n=1 Tax=Nocardia sp. NPDC005366 TaxID=3156878 RepID=UPI0033BC689E
MSAQTALSSVTMLLRADPGRRGLACREAVGGGEGDGHQQFEFRASFGLRLFRPFAEVGPGSMINAPATVRIVW